MSCYHCVLLMSLKRCFHLLNQATFGILVNRYCYLISLCGDYCIHYVDSVYRQGRTYPTICQSFQNGDDDYGDHVVSVFAVGLLHLPLMMKTKNV
jgi:hypothetical protein